VFCQECLISYQNENDFVGWFFSDSMLMGMVDFLFILVFSMLPEGNENAQSPRSPSGLFAFATPVAGFYRCIVPFVLEFSGFLLLN
jgi:hypothetical protein